MPKFLISLILCYFSCSGLPLLCPSFFPFLLLNCRLHVRPIKHSRNTVVVFGINESVFTKLSCQWNILAWFFVSKMRVMHASSPYLEHEVDSAIKLRFLPSYYCSFSLNKRDFVRGEVYYRKRNA